MSILNLTLKILCIISITLVIYILATIMLMLFTRNEKIQSIHCTQYKYNIINITYVGPVCEEADSNEEFCQEDSI